MTAAIVVGGGFYGAAVAAYLKTERGFVVNPANGRKLSYGEIAASGKVPNPLPAVAPNELKPRSQYRLIGTNVPRRDIPSKLMVFPDENHWVLKPKNSIQWYSEVFAWMDRWMGDDAR